MLTSVTSYYSVALNLKMTVLVGAGWTDAITLLFGIRFDTAGTMSNIKLSFSVLQRNKCIGERYEVLSSGFSGKVKEVSKEKLMSLILALLRQR